MKPILANSSKVSISNIAWPPEADDRAHILARSLGFEGIEVAPGRTFSNWDALDEASAFRARLAAQGLRVPALQAILFGVRECALFESSATRQNLKRHLTKVARVAGKLGAHASVFGAPKLRDPGALRPDVAWTVAVEFFSEVAEAFEKEGTALAFEANAAVYDCRFVTTTAEAIRLVREVDRPGFRLQLDTGTVFLEGEDPEVVAQAVPLAAHFHASEPQLATLGSQGVDHARIGAILAATNYAGWRSVEMRAVPDWEVAMAAAAKLMSSDY